MEACKDCGNDDPAEGYKVCSDCLSWYHGANRHLCLLCEED